MIPQLPITPVYIYENLLPNVRPIATVQIRNRASICDAYIPHDWDLQVRINFMAPQGWDTGDLFEMSVDNDRNQINCDEIYLDYYGGRKLARHLVELMEETGRFLGLSEATVDNCRNHSFWENMNYDLDRMGGRFKSLEPKGLGYRD